MSINVANQEPLPKDSDNSVEVREMVISLCRRDYAPSIIEIDMLERIDAGHQKYGTYLKTFNGRDALVDAYQEILDAIQYAVQYHLETRKDSYYHLAKMLVATAELTRSLISGRVVQQ